MWLKKAVLRALLRALRSVRRLLHQPHNLDELVVGRAVPRWSCADHDVGEMQARATPLLPEVRPTFSAQKEAARQNKRRLVATRPKDGERFRTHVGQSGIIDLTCLGGAATSTPGFAL